MDTCIHVEVIGQFMEVGSFSYNVGSRDWTHILKFGTNQHYCWAILLAYGYWLVTKLSIIDYKVSEKFSFSK